MTTRDSLLVDANRSGFPLQIAVERAVRNTKDSHGWTVTYVEHSWADQTEGRSGFVDMVLRDQHNTSTLVVECKRVRDSNWLFMRSDGTASENFRVKGWISRFAGGGWRAFGWHDLAASPRSVEAMFCTVRGQADGNPMLERVASELVSATAAIANEERDYRSSTEALQMYFSVIVTTATLNVCGFSPESIAIGDGTIPAAEFSTVPCVRFRKQLSVTSQPFTMKDYSSGTDPSVKKEHTVFVVNSIALTDFLAGFSVQAESLRRYI